MNRRCGMPRKKIYDWPGVEYHSTEWWRLWRVANADKYGEYRRKYQRDAFKLKPKQEHDRRKKYALKYPEKIKVYSIVSKVIKLGKLVRSACVDCGSTTKIHGHHEDYTKPLEVIWLCPVCHKKRH
jgi:hypothetical protein